MKRKLIFNGELKDLFGTELPVSCDTFQDALKCADANREGFRKYLLDAANNGVEFEVREEENNFIMNPIASGAKSGGGKILAALAILALIVINPGSVFLGGTGMIATPITTAGYMAASIATNLALTGIQQLLAPDPSSDADEPTSYLFNGAEQNVLEGDPVPVLYGELRVPGTPISFEILNRKFHRNNVSIDSEGNLILVGV